MAGNLIVLFGWGLWFLITFHEWLKNDIFSSNLNIFDQAVLCAQVLMFSLII